MPPDGAQPHAPGLVALREGRKYVGVDINAEYLDMTKDRISEAMAQTDFLRGVA